MIDVLNRRARGGQRDRSDRAQRAIPQPNPKTARRVPVISRICSGNHERSSVERQHRRVVPLFRRNATEHGVPRRRLDVAVSPRQRVRGVNRWAVRRVRGVGRERDAHLLGVEEA